MLRIKENIRHEPHEKSPPLVRLDVGVQDGMLALSNTVTVVTIYAVSSDGSASYLSWAVFECLLIDGLATAHHAVKIWPPGAGVHNAD